MLNKLLTWHWGPGGKFGLGTALGIIVVIIPSIIFIALDLAKVTRQVEPPPFLGDWAPTTQQVCDDFPAPEKVQLSNKAWQKRGWSAWPNIETMPCGETHEPAPNGTVRWHSCKSSRKVGKLITVPCPVQTDGNIPKGITWAHIVDNKIVAADIYVWPKGSSCIHQHEEGHARGFVNTPEEDAKTPYVKGAHTERPGHLLGEGCGDGWSWLDRTKDGDWPYDDEEPGVSEEPEDSEETSD